jgi:geranylgeranyl pyrophosphate synthase
MRRADSRQADEAPAITPAEAGYRRRLALVNAGLEAVLPGLSVEPKRLHEAMRHAVFAGGGGKRLRPVILLTVAADLGLPEDRALPAAMALELLHNYSLVHDDLPCMDDARLRRGAPSVQAAFGYTDAVLAGDALLTLAFEVLGRAGNSGLPRPGDLIVELALAGGSVGMVGGQHADLDHTGVSAARLGSGGEHSILAIHRLKTARLFGFAFTAAGYLASGAGHLASGAGHPASAPGFATAVARADMGRVIEKLRAAGESFGLAFQVLDDIRDAAEDGQAPNYAKAAGAEKARQVALDLSSRCQEALQAAFGEASEILQLVREAVREMGL